VFTSGQKRRMTPQIKRELRRRRGSADQIRERQEIEPGPKGAPWEEELLSLRMPIDRRPGSLFEDV
jgi:hypothetical protein